MTRPWWLAGGEEECPLCEQRYAYEIEVRCVDCDEAMCPICAMWVERRSYCRGCAQRNTPRQPRTSARSPA